jgi:hypothetical protein
MQRAFIGSKNAWPHHAHFFRTMTVCQLLSSEEYGKTTLENIV